jgi:transcriptional regulator with XRE-family HTH domain
MLEHVGHNVRKLRRERDLTQTQVARFVRIRQQELSAIERGLRPRSELLDRFARALGVNVDDLLREPLPRVSVRAEVMQETAQM